VNWLWDQLALLRGLERRQNVIGLQRLCGLSIRQSCRNGPMVDICTHHYNVFIVVTMFLSGNHIFRSSCFAQSEDWRNNYIHISA
jgi:hypothetical protein